MWFCQVFSRRRPLSKLEIKNAKFNLLTFSVIDKSFRSRFDVTYTYQIHSSRVCKPYLFFLLGILRNGVGFRVRFLTASTTYLRMMNTPTCCHFSTQNSSSGVAWRPEDTAKPTPARPNASDIYRPEILDHIESTIKELDGELRELSLDIHGRWYIAKKTWRFIDYLEASRPPGTLLRRVVRHLRLVVTPAGILTERYSYAHDVLTSFMAKHGFEVTKHFHLETAWRAAFSHGTGGRTIGVNSEVYVSFFCFCHVTFVDPSAFGI